MLLMKNLLSNDIKISFLQIFTGLTLNLPNYSQTQADLALLDVRSLDLIRIAFFLARRC